MNKINTALLAFITTLCLSACGGSEDVNRATDAMPSRETQVIDCLTPLKSGEILTLENRNNGVDYRITCVLEVDGDLVIAPNVTIEFTTDAGISVEDGSIKAIGTAESPIVFTGKNKSPGAWKGIIVESSDTQNKLSFVQIDYAGGTAFNSNDDRGAIIVWADARLTVENSAIGNSETYGINANYGDSILILNNNTITSSDAPMSILASYASSISGGTFTGNTTDAIIVNSAGIDVAATWHDLGVPYQLPSGFKVVAGGTLTIEAGVTLEFGLNALLSINEGASGPKPSLIAVGTAQKPITFTGINKVKSSWQGLYFDTPSVLNEIGFVTIEYASVDDNPGAVYTWYGTVLNVHDVSFKQIAKDGIHVKKSPSTPHGILHTDNSFTNVDGANFVTSN